MFFRQFYLESLGHASYIVGDEDAGKALVFDPQRDVTGYFAAARSRGLQISYALDSHGHNDYLSGLTKLKERTDLDVLGFHDADIGYGHIDGARFITGAELPRRIDEVPGSGPLAVICGSGFRSSSVASLLKHHGRGEIFSVIGGMSAWDAAGYGAVT